MKNISIQNGDVVFEAVSLIPKEAKRINLPKGRSGFVYETGEGRNEHSFACENMSDLCSLVECYELNGEMYFRVKKGITLKHEEHGTQIIKKGIYKKNIEQVFDYEKMESEKVRD